MARLDFSEIAGKAHCSTEEAARALKVSSREFRRLLSETPQAVAHFRTPATGKRRGRAKVVVESLTAYARSQGHEVCASAARSALLISPANRQSIVGRPSHELIVATNLFAAGAIAATRMLDSVYFDLESMPPEEAASVSTELRVMGFLGRRVAVATATGVAVAGFFDAVQAPAG